MKIIVPRGINRGNTVYIVHALVLGYYPCYGYKNMTSIHNYKYFAILSLCNVVTCNTNISFHTRNH